MHTTPHSMTRVIFGAICALALLAPCNGANNSPFWIQKSPPAMPSARESHTMAYDAANGQVILFGGNSGDVTTGSHETWAWNGTTWTNVSPATNNPPARSFAAMAYDAAHRQVLMFGGVGTNAANLNDTWAWNGATWSNVTPATNNPSARNAPMMAYDAAHGKVVLFGGNANATELNDTWVWNGSAWSNVTPSTNNPPARSGGAMAYDAAHGQMVLFGGFSGPYVNDTWVWNGTNWANVTPAANNPPVRYKHALAYDAARNQVVLFGGVNGSALLDDTWVWNGSAWTQENPTAKPSSRYSVAMAYDARHDRVVLFGGDTSSSVAAPQNDTWVWSHAISSTAGGNPQSAPTGSGSSALFVNHLEVTVVDNNGNYVNAAQVTYSGPANMVVLSSGTALTGSDGRALVDATATLTAGSYNVTATVNGTDFALFTLSNVNTAAATGPCQVTTALDDNSAGSLRSQVASCGKGGIITFASGLTRVIVSQGQDIQLTQDLTIDGGSGVTIDAGSSSRIFFVFDGNINLKNLTLQNGLSRAGDGGNGNGAGGGAAGMGGAVFVNGGTLSVTSVNFANNQALGGNGGMSGTGIGGGGGIGGDGGSPSTGVGNGGGGGDFGGGAGLGADGTGGDGDIGNGAGLTGFGGGGGGGRPTATTGMEGFGGAGGFGGGGGSGKLPGGGGDFGGDPSHDQPLGGGGAGLGGAIFVRNGTLMLAGTSFTSNTANRGLAGGAGATSGQGKGGALFIYSGAMGIYSGGVPTFSGNSAADAGGATLCNTVVGASALDTNDVCGAVGQLPVIAWSNPAAITYGTALSSTQLNATANVPGAFTYTPPAGTVLNAGTRTLSVTFTPTDTSTYVIATKSVSITVNQALPIVTWSNPAPITYGTALGSTQLNATANVPGFFAYSPAAGTVLNAGVNQTLSVTFTPSDTANYSTVMKSVSITVNQATPFITWTNPAAITYGTALSSTQLNAAANVPGAFVYSPQAGTVLNGGVNQTLSVTFTPTDATNYMSVTATVKITVNPVAQTISFPNPGDQIYGTPVNLAATATSGLAVSFASTTPSVCTVSGSTLTLLAIGLCSVQATQAGNTNYLAATAVTQNFHVLVNVSAKVQVTQNGFVRNRATGLWVATMTVTNISGSAISGPIQVLFTNITPTVTMANPTGSFNGVPYITVSAGALGAGGSVNVTIQFNNPSNGLIGFTPVTYSGDF